MSVVEAITGGVRIRVKAVPGASRDEISGVLGDRLKIRVSKPPEGGKANKAIAGVLAGALGARAADVELVSGVSNAEKVFDVAGVSVDAVRTALGIDDR